MEKPFNYERMVWHPIKEEGLPAAGANVLITAITRRGTVQVFRAAWNAEMGLWQGGGVIRQKC